MIFHKNKPNLNTNRLFIPLYPHSISGMKVEGAEGRGIADLEKSKENLDAI